MLTKKPWILTKKGVALTKKFVAASSVGFLCYEVFPNTILLPFKRAKLEEAMQKKIGLPDLPYQVQEYVRRALDDMKFTEDQRKRLSVYLSDSHAVETLGNVNTGFGALVKLPWVLWNNYPIPDSVKGKEGEKNPEATKQYLESLVWSDKAKLFFSAYQVAWTTRYQFLGQGILNALAIACAFTACYTATFTKYAVTDKFKALLAVNFLLLSLICVAWIFCTDFSACENEQDIITEVCSLGPDYAEGAVELYKKLAQHNRAVREMAGYVGRIKFNEEGITRSLRRVTLPLNERLALAEECLEKHKTESKSLNVTTKSE